MKMYEFEVITRIVVRAEAETEEEARAEVQEDLAAGEYSYSLDSAEPELRLIHVSGELA